MSKIILIHANCNHTHAKGDFNFAASIAADLSRRLTTLYITDVQVILTSDADAMVLLD